MVGAVHSPSSSSSQSSGCNAHFRIHPIDTNYIITTYKYLLSIRVRNFLGNIIIALKVMEKGNEMYCSTK